MALNIELEEADKVAVLEVFKLADTNGDGKVDREEFVRLCKARTQLNDEQLSKLLTSFDSDADGKLDCNEFATWTIDSELGEKLRVWNSILTSSQKANEAKLFGPFVALSLDDAMEMDKVWGMMQAHAAKTGGNIGVELFTQYAHWAAMIFASGLKNSGNFRKFSRKSKSLSVGNTPFVREEDSYQVYCSMVDIIVPEIAPDLFRFIDHNGDGELQKAEWDNINTVIAKGLDGEMAMEFALDLFFTVIDKNGSKTIEVSELVAFFDKILKLAVQVAISGVNISATAGGAAYCHEGVNSAFDEFDADSDGKLTIEECTKDYDSQLLEALIQLPQMALALTSPDAPEGIQVTLAKIGFSAIQQLDGFAGDVREAFMQLVKTIIAVNGGALLAELQKSDMYMAMVQADNAKQWVKNLEQTFEDLKAGKFDKQFRDFSDALFDVLDTDGDGKVSTSEVNLWTQCLLSPCEGEEMAKARIQQIFASLAGGKEEPISKERLFSFFMKLGKLAKNLTLLLLEIAADWVSTNVGSIITAAMEFYKKYRKATAEVEVDRLDKAEFQNFLMLAPEWGMMFAQQQTSAEAIL